MKKDYANIMTQNGSFVAVNSKLEHLIGLQESSFLSKLINSQIILGKEFYFTRKQFELYFCFSERVLRRVEKKLINLRLINIVNKGRHNKNHYIIYHKRIYRLINETRRHIKSLESIEDKLELRKNYKKYKRSLLTNRDKYSSQNVTGHTSIYNKNIDKSKDSLKNKNLGSLKSSLEEEIVLKNKFPKLVQKPKQDKKIAHTKYSITAQDYLLYNELIALGGTRHREKTKAHSRTLEEIHRLLSKNCINPYANLYVDSDHTAKVLQDKVWTIEEIIETYKFHLEENGVIYKSIGTFIAMRFGVKTAFSPLLNFYRQLQKSKEHYASFNGTAKRILDFINKNSNEGFKHKPGIFVRAGDLVDDLAKTWEGNPNLIHPENNLQYQFIQFLGRKMNSQKFKIPYMVSDFFLNEFVTESAKQGRIVNKKTLRH